MIHSDEKESNSGVSEMEEPEPTKTFSYDDSDDSDYEDKEEELYDDDDDDDDYDDDDDDDDDDGDDEIDENDDCPFWRQHIFAILVALFASVGAHFYNRTSVVGSAVGSPLSIANNMMIDKHDHLKGISRTANISFCLQDIQSFVKIDRLHPMDFYIPRDQFESLQAFYVADQIEDDTYAETDNNNIVPIKSNGRHNILLKGHAEFQCLFQQHKKKADNVVKFKGVTHFYKEPTLEDMYPELTNPKKSSSSSSSIDSSNSPAISSKERQRKLQQPPLTFTGFATKFVNLNNKPVLLYWDGKGGNENSRKLVGEIPPMESIGTATMPGHGFHITPIYDPSMILQRWLLTPDTALVFYEPKHSMEMMEELQIKDPKMYGMYQRQLVNQAFSRDYTVVSKRTWLAQFPRRFPMQYMHPASYIGQEHHVGDMTLTVASVVPKVFRIDDFLSPDECKEVIRLGLEQGLEQSTLHSSSLARQNRDNSTRSSTNAWLSGDTNSLTKKIYQKAAKLSNIDSNLFQNFHESSGAHYHSIAESLQVVRYKKGEEYTPHHDFVSPSINDRYQPSRFATLLIYLNDVEEGGETRFPRAVNNYNAEGLEIKPKAGTAVLFYNMLEDGNFDDLSQHGGNKVLKGNKWLANLWIWDPVIG